MSKEALEKVINSARTSSSAPPPSPHLLALKARKDELERAVRGFPEVLASLERRLIAQAASNARLDRLIQRSGGKS